MLMKAPAGAKARDILRFIAARLKSCPVTKHVPGWTKHVPDWTTKPQNAGDDSKHLQQFSNLQSG
jgi:hypothetical protein